LVSEQHPGSGNLNYQTSKNSWGYYGMSVRMLKNLLDQQKLFSQQIADQNQKISMIQEHMKEIEKQRDSLEDSVPNSVMVNGGEIWGSEHAGSEEVQLRRNIMHFNPKVEFPTFDGSNPRNWVKKYAKYFNLCRILGNQKLDLALMYLQAKAETWFSSYILERKHTV